MTKYKIDDWLRLKGQSDRECVHVIQIREQKCSIGSQFWYEVRLVCFNSYGPPSSKLLFIINEIEIAEKIEEPKPNKKGF